MAKTIVHVPRQGPVDVAPYLERAGVTDKDVVIIGGTLVEGIGNEFSDIDIYVIRETYQASADLKANEVFRAITTGREIATGCEDDNVLLVHLPIGDSGVKVDIEFKTFSDIETIAREIDSIYDYAVENPILLTRTMSERAMSLVHRLHSGIILHQEPTARQLLARLDQGRFRYLLYRWGASDFADLLDVIGAWRSGEVLRCVDLARENMIKQMHAYLCLIGCTDYKRKWILTRLAASDAPDDLKNGFQRLFVPGAGLPHRDYIVQTLDLVDAVFVASGLYLDRVAAPWFPPRASVLDWLDRRHHGARQHYERLEAAYRRKAYMAAPDAPTRLLLNP